MTDVTLYCVYKKSVEVIENVPPINQPANCIILDKLSRHQSTTMTTLKVVIKLKIFYVFQDVLQELIEGLERES